MWKKFFTERFFNWTKKDVAAWEEIRSRGLARFILWYGLRLTGGGLFVLVGLVDALIATINRHLATLPLELGLIALLCLLGGLASGLLTWWMEDALYHKFKKIHSQENPS